jgi:hypothetical protein
MVLLTLARFVLEKTGGDSMAEVRDSMDRWRARLAQVPGAAGAGPRNGAGARVTAMGGEAEPAEGGTAGSGGDD